MIKNKIGGVIGGKKERKREGINNRKGKTKKDEKDRKEEKERR